MRKRTLFSRFSIAFGSFGNLAAMYAALGIILSILVITTIPFISYHEDQVYPKNINRSSSLDPYDRGGVPFGQTQVHAQYPENSPSIGYVTAYLTPFSAFLAGVTLYLGTTIVSHPGGILDEILYNTRGLDTVVETAILFTAFAIASLLYRRKN
jgi:energy-converting hydrogenase A subunit F